MRFSGGTGNNEQQVFAGTLLAEKFPYSLTDFGFTESVVDSIEMLSSSHVNISVAGGFLHLLMAGLPAGHLVFEVKLRAGGSESETKYYSLVGSIKAK